MVEHGSTHPFTNGDGGHPLNLPRLPGRLPYTLGAVVEGGRPLLSQIFKMAGGKGLYCLGGKSASTYSISFLPPV